MKVSELLMLGALLVLSGLLAIALMEAAGRMGAKIQKYEQQIEKRNEALHAYMFPDPIMVHVSGESPYVDDGLTYFVTRPESHDSEEER